jgi:DNA-binding CsgD family transcriptional regulator
VERPALTARERDVLQRAALGESYLAIARVWGTGVQAVKSRARSAMRRLGADSIAHAVHLADLQGLISPHGCGHPDTYWWHLRHGEPTDDLCRAAHAALRKEQRDRTGAWHPDGTAPRPETRNP